MCVCAWCSNSNEMLTKSATHLTRESIGANESSITFCAHIWFINSIYLLIPSRWKRLDGHGVWFQFWIHYCILIRWWIITKIDAVDSHQKKKYNDERYCYIQQKRRGGICTWRTHKLEPLTRNKLCNEWALHYLGGSAGNILKANEMRLSRSRDPKHFN